MTAPNLKVASAEDPQPQRSPERQRLAEAHVRRDEAARDVEEARRALARGRDAVAKAEAGLAAAQAATAAAAEHRAAELQRAADLEQPPPGSTMRRARAAELEAEDEVNAARAALAGLQARLGTADDALWAANNLLTAYVDCVLRSLAQRTLADAEAAAERFLQARMLLLYFLHPERYGKPVIMNQAIRPVFEESWTDAVRMHGTERATRRAEAAEAAREVRDEGFTGELAEAIARHLDRALQGIYERSQPTRWTMDLSLAPWQEAREALLQNPEAELPG
jgi:hypothetical protein